ncbi:protein transport protein Sec24A [Osmerus eperlanus]|uniref:protein transport protein Sec24A n=1 Tax=Osmerus eperlanus TaxID=29151 RepID=UPI002E0F2DD3
MSTTGFNSQNGSGRGQAYANGPSQNPVPLQPPGQGYNMPHQIPYNPMQAKAPMPPGPGLYNSGPYQPGPPASSYQGPPGPPMMTRPPMGSLGVHTPPQSSSPSPGPSPIPGPRMSPLQGAPTPPASANSYYPAPPQQQPAPPAWQYGAPRPMGAPPPMATPPLGPMGNHHTASSSPGPPPSAVGYGVAAPVPPPPAFHNATPPPGPGLPPTTVHGYVQRGSAPPPMNPSAPNTYQPGRGPYGPPLPGAPLPGQPPSMRPTPPPTGPPMANATPPPPPRPPEGLSQPQMLIVSDIDDIFLPTPDSLLVNFNECKELVQALLKSLPQMFSKTMETQSALGPALQSAFKLLSPTGGRVSVYQTQLPNVGVGALKSREDPNQRASAKDIQHLSPATDFYKKLALDCSGQQVAVDLFLLSSQYCDLASLGCISRYSAGSVYYYPSYHQEHNPAQVERFQKDLKRYLTRKIGFEAVMRIRCTKGLSIHTFHGNFFVRSTDLLSLPNVNPDAGFAVQMSIEENLVDLQTVSFQAALLYTSSKGERRIRVHTMCLPVVNSLSDIFAGADVQAITGLLASMAVDRSVTASLSDARDAMTNAAIDSLASYRSAVLTVQQPGLLAPACLRLFPLYILALLKQVAFRTGTSTRLDDRVFSMCQLKYQPLAYVMLMIHPALYRLDDLSDEGALNISERTIPQPRLLQLSVEKLTREGAFLLDAGSVLYLWVGRSCSPHFLSKVLGAASYAAVPQVMNSLPELDTAESQRTRAFIGWLKEQRPFFPLLHVIRDESPLKSSFMQNMIEDRTESALSYYEFLLHVQQQVSK